MRLWKINCMEDDFPGMWQREFREQSIGIGWPPAHGHHLRGVTMGGQGWARCRNALLLVQRGDFVVVQLRGNRVGRIGQIVDLEIEDNQWNPLVPADSSLPHGEMGRRILVRWDLAAGPDERDQVVRLPPQVQFTSGELRPTLSEIRSVTLKELRAAMCDSANWEGLLPTFAFERSISDYLAAYPQRLEDGLLPHPSRRIRERRLSDRKRIDVMLIDRADVPVVVECKQGQPTIANIEQLRHYMKVLVENEGFGRVRGILVHGGARKLNPEILKAAKKHPSIEIVQYRCDVDFSRSG